jgi:hypothetical protein
LVAAIVVVWTTPAVAEFGDPQRLSNPDKRSYRPQVSVDPEGNALVLWEQQYAASPYHLRARRISSDGERGPIKAITDGSRGIYEYQATMDVDGNGYIVWVRSHSERVEGRAYLADGTLGPVETISKPDRNARSVRATVDENGNLLVVWVEDSGVLARRRSAAGAIGPIFAVARPAPEAASLRVDTDAAGNAIVAWQDGVIMGAIKAREISADGTLGPIEELSTGKRNSIAQLAVNADGDAVLVWTQLFRAADDQLQTRLRVRYRPAGADFDDLETLVAGAVFGPTVAIDQDGRALVAWTVGRERRARIRAVRRDAEGELGPLHSLSSMQHGAKIAMRPNGEAVILGLRRDWSSYAQTLSADDELGPVQKLGGALNADIAIGDSGPAVAVGEALQTIYGALGP